MVSEQFEAAGPSRGRRAGADPCAPGGTDGGSEWHAGSLADSSSQRHAHPGGDRHPVSPFTPTPGPELETPIGAAPTYLIHSVRDGESLSFLAQAYGSSPEAIQAANGLGSLPLWIGQLVVIPVGISDPAGVPRFAVVRVAVTGETLPDLAAREAADPEDIRRYNALGDDPWLPPGRWLIVPLP